MSALASPSFKQPVVKVHSIYTKSKVSKTRSKQKLVVFDCDLSIQAMISEREHKLVKPNRAPPMESHASTSPSKPNATQSPLFMQGLKPKTLKNCLLEPEFPSLVPVTLRPNALFRKPRQGKIKRTLSSKIVPVSPLSNLLLKIQENSSYQNLSPWSGMNSRELTSSRSSYGTMQTKILKIATVKFP